MSKGNIAFALVLFAVELISFLKMSRLEEYVLSSFFFDKKFVFYRKVARWKMSALKGLNWLEMCVQVKNQFCFESQFSLCQNYQIYVRVGEGQLKPSQPQSFPVPELRPLLVTWNQTGPNGKLGVLLTVLHALDILFLTESSNGQMVTSFLKMSISHLARSTTVLWCRTIFPMSW